MSQLTIQLSDKADALIAQLQKEIFNRRRKKVSAAGVIETLVESGAKSQSDKRFATSWKNLISDIEKAAKVADAHGAKPANLSDEEWAMVLSHRTRAKGKAKPNKIVAGQAAAKMSTLRKADAADRPLATRPATSAKTARAAKAAPNVAATSRDRSSAKAKAGSSAKTGAAAKAPEKAPAKGKTAAAKAMVAKSAATKPAVKAATPVTSGGRKARSSVARRMAKAVSRLSSGTAAPPLAASVASANGAVPPLLSSGA
jgi:hypothetical protein